MKRQNVLKTIFLSLVLASLSSSCGLIEKFKTPEQPVDSKSSETLSTAVVEKQDPGTDDLFSKAMNDTKEEPLHAGTDAPTNIATENPVVKDDLKSLEEEFSGNAAKESAPKAVAETETKQVKVEESLPEIKPELPPAVVENTNSDAGKIMNYKVQKGETLMQIAFKIYGDVSKWKDIKQMNGEKFSKSSALRTNMELKYTAPAQVFVWNPEGTPYMVKNGETLGTISNSVYQTPKKWKNIWENNKPLIKNPNVIYAGFTLYYKGSEMANYVQPKANERKLATKVEAKIEESKVIEEVKVEPAISNQEVKEEVKEEVKIDPTQDEALVR